MQWTLNDGAGALAIDSTGRIYAIRDDRLLAISAEGQVQWTVQTDGHIGSSPAIGPDGTVHVGSADSSLYAIGDATTTSRPDRASIPTAHALGNNYPNPFNPVTRIPCDLPEPTWVRIEVINWDQVVRVLQEGSRLAGQHMARFDGSCLPSGVYWYHMEAGTFTKTRAMSLDNQARSAPSRNRSY